MTDATVEKEEAPITASSMLSAARQAAGLSQDEVAEQLYLTPSFIRYIDGDEIDKLPKKAFIKGYLRSYAKLVNLDGDEVVQQYEQGDIGGSSHSIEIRRVTDQRVGSINFTGPVFQTGVGGLIALIVVVAMVWWFSSSNEKPPVTVSEYKPVEEEPAAATPFQLPERTSLEITASDQPDASDPDLADISLIEETEIEPATEVETAPESSSDEQSLPEPEADDIAAQESTAQESTALESTALEDNILESEAVDEDGSEDSSDDQSVINDLTPLEPGKPILIERETIGAVNYIRVDAGGSDSLKFVFTDDCWLEIEDGDEIDIFGDLGRPGDELTVTGVAPFSVLFGKAPAVKMEFNGDLVDLQRYTADDDTAKVRVGR